MPVRFAHGARKRTKEIKGINNSSFVNGMYIFVNTNVSKVFILSEKWILRIRLIGSLNRLV